MATIALTPLSRSGVTVEDVAVAAAAGGDQFQNKGSEIFVLKNAGTAKVATFVTQKTVDGQAVGDRAVTVQATETTLVDCLPADVYNDANGYVQVTYDAVTSLTVAVLTPHLVA